MAADAAQLPKIAEEVLDATLAKLSPEVFEAIRDVRNDATETNWYTAARHQQPCAAAREPALIRGAPRGNWPHRLLARHRNNEPLEIELAGSGSGGVSEMAANLDDTTFMYGFCTYSARARAASLPRRFLRLADNARAPPGTGAPAHPVRITELIDGVSKTVKFLYIYFTGEEVPYNKRGRLGVVHGGVRQHFQVRPAGAAEPWPVSTTLTDLGSNAPGRRHAAAVPHRPGAHAQGGPERRGGPAQAPREPVRQRRSRGVKCGHAGADAVCGEACSGAGRTGGRSTTSRTAASRRIPTCR